MKGFTKKKNELICPICDQKGTFIETGGDNVWCTNCTAPFDEEYILGVCAI